MPALSLTVLMTVRNGMPYLEEAVRCILGQTRQDFTFLILNNASTDGTRAFLDATEAALGGGLPDFPLRTTPGCDAEHDRGAVPPADPPRPLRTTPGCVLALRHLPADAGRTGALQMGLDAVDTDLVAVMDADDLCPPERLERQSGFLAAHPETDLLGSDVEYVDASGKCTARDRFPTTHEELRDTLPLRNPFANSACMFRTAAARAAGGYDRSFPYAQDLALWTAMLRRGSRAASIGDVLAGIRRHAGQATQDAALAGARARDDYRIAESMLGIPGLSTAARQAALARAACALLRMGERGNAVKTALRALREAPLLCFRNPLLLRRAGMELRSRICAKRV
ncbi:MAG: glycosyltransferase family 2 protein [Desulfovibrio sp.]|jgi:glycosyltransferase involved in cell wall biosynthesis|nr:glycosyltransferase family 2 protein [Desulfovibrio sp.]